MDDPHVVDKRLVRRSFERAAGTYDAAAVLQHEIGRRLLERLDYIRLAPAAILDAGCGTGNAVAGLLERYPRARVIALDLALAMTRRARARRRWWNALLDRGGTRLDAVCGDIEQLPLAPASVGLVWSNLAIQWLSEPRQAFTEFHRALAPGGLFLFSSFGPDTLKELRAAFQGLDRHTHVQRFMDMHDVGDSLLACGYADPVMDAETLTLTYADLRGLMGDLKAIGAHNSTRGRPAGLAGQALFARAALNYEGLRREGRLPATFEVVYGHAWKPAPRTSPTGHPVIDIKPRSG
jgi:malonyl-CoA O-methyltransferase